MMPDDDIEVLYRDLVKFVPEVALEPDEIQAIEDGRMDRAENENKLKLSDNHYIHMVYN